MSFYLNVFIGGVCGFCPDKPVQPLTKNLVWVLLPETKDRKKVCGHPVRQHYPELWFDPDDIDKVNTSVPYTTGGGDAVWELEKDDLTIKDAGRPQTESGLVITSGLKQSKRSCVR